MLSGQRKKKNIHISQAYQDSDPVFLTKKTRKKTKKKLTQVNSDSLSACQRSFAACLEMTFSLPHFPQHTTRLKFLELLWGEETDPAFLESTSLLPLVWQHRILGFPRKF